MKYFGLIALSVLLSPAMAVAQSSPQDAPPMTSPDGAPPAGMQQMRRQSMQLRMETRAQMLAALSPQHLTLLGNLVGRLATSPTPDLQAAAAQLDSALSPGESQSIVAAATALRGQMRGGMQGGMQGGTQGAMPIAGPNGAPPAHAPDPGMALLRSALAVGAAPRPQRNQ